MSRPLSALRAVHFCSAVFFFTVALNHHKEFLQSYLKVQYVRINFKFFKELLIENIQTLNKASIKCDE